MRPHQHGHVLGGLHLLRHIRVVGSEVFEELLALLCTAATSNPTAPLSPPLSPLGCTSLPHQLTIDSWGNARAAQKASLAAICETSTSPATINAVALCFLCVSVRCGESSGLSSPRTQACVVHALASTRRIRIDACRLVVHATPLIHAAPAEKSSSEGARCSKSGRACAPTTR